MCRHSQLPLDLLEVVGFFLQRFQHSDSKLMILSNTRIRDQHDLKSLRHFGQHSMNLRRRPNFQVPGERVVPVEHNLFDSHLL